MCIGNLHALLFLPLIAVPEFLLLFLHDCACACSARGGRFVIGGRLVDEGKLVREKSC